jgi:hypothetical protein
MGWSCLYVGIFYLPNYLPDLYQIWYEASKQNFVHVLFISVHTVWLQSTIYMNFKYNITKCLI